MNSENNVSVISLGGSLIAPESGLDTDFLQSFQDMVRERISDRQFCIITGGGAICREYQEGLHELSDADDKTLDWMGIYMTRMHGQFIRLMFDDVAHQEVTLTPEATAQADAPVVVGAAGDTPGHSSDYEAVAVADAVGADHLINLSDTSYIYSADPDKDPEAEPLEQLSWQAYQNLIPDTWEPGLHTPFDPVSAAYARECNLEVAVMNGKPTDNVANYIDNKDFTGTTIYPA